MISKKINYNIKNVGDRINYLIVRIQHLKDLLKKYEPTIDPLAFESISRYIETHERELKIRRDFPFNY